MTTTTTTTTTIAFYEGSYQFKSETTTMSVGDSYIEYCLAKQYEYRETTESLWAEVVENGVRSRFVFTPGVGVEQFVFWKMHVSGDTFVSKKSLVVSESATHFRVIFDQENKVETDVHKSLVV